MKNWRKLLALALVLVMSFALVACGDPAPASSTPAAESTPAIVESTPEEPVESEPESVPEEPVESEGEPEEVVFGTSVETPRNETLYYNGIQWGSPINNNPFSSNSNNGMVVGQSDLARELVYETLYMYNQSTGGLHPLLAVDQPEWNADRTELTVKMNPAAKWSDGTAVTADDVKATFDAHVASASGTGTDYGQYISAVNVVDASTVTFVANTENHNPLKMLEYLPKVYVLQKAYIDGKLATYGDDFEGFKNDQMFDLVYSGAYGPLFYSSQKLVLQRNDSYWGAQADGVWGKLAEPKFIAHNIFKDNDSGASAFRLGEVDIAQQFMSGVPAMWEEEGLPVSTYLPAPLCYQSASIPSIWFNTTAPGLDQLAVREAIAYAIDYDQINESAMYGYSPTFADAPRSIAVPLEGEQKYIDNAALADLQWGSMDYERSNQILDDAGIVDSDSDGFREYNGTKLEFTAMCPKGWSDWEASLEIVAAAGANIGLDIRTNFVEAAVWTDALQTGDFTIIMNGMISNSITAPWGRAYNALNVTDPTAERVFWGYHRMQNDEINTMIAEAALETDEAVLKETYTEISRFLLEQKPIVALMYRPSLFHTANETVWTGFQFDGDGTDIPPQLVSDGYGYAALYNLHLVG